ncbi:glycosyltransferase [Dickeya oryzae]
MRILVVVVTYGNRAELVKEVVTECISQSVYKIIIVDNGSPECNFQKLELINKEYSFDVELIRLNENMGSAKGFSVGLSRALEHSTEDDWVLFLDDDNKIEKNAIRNMCHQFHCGEIHKDNVYFFLRKDRKNYLNFLKNRNEDDLLGVCNSFIGFHIIDFCKKKISYRERSENFDLSCDDSVVRCPCGPYGGLLIYSKTVAKVGFPDDKLYLYFDDTEYTLRMNRLGVSLWLLPKSKISDIDISWSNIENKKKFSSPLLETSDDFRVYYSVRNRVFFRVELFGE